MEYLLSKRLKMYEDEDFAVVVFGMAFITYWLGTALFLILI